MDNANNKLLELLRLETDEMHSSFVKAKVEGKGTSQEVADRTENAVKKFLEKYFPFPYKIVKGNIIDSYGLQSNSIDCIVLNPSHPYTIDPNNEKASIIFADAVDAAIEVKSELCEKSELFRVLGQIQSVKKLRRKQPILLGNRYTQEKLDVLHRIPTYIFADKAYKNISVLINHILYYYTNNRVPLCEQFDYIVINNRALIINSYKDSYAQIGLEHGIWYAMTNKDTLAVFLTMLNSNPKSIPEIGLNIIPLYLNIRDLVKSYESTVMMEEGYKKMMKLL